MKESEKIYQDTVIGYINKKEVKALICINDNGINLKEVISEMKKKYKNL